MKRCSRCGIEKELDAFAKAHRGKDGLNGWCKFCHKAYRIKHKEQIAARGKEYYKTHSDYQKQYYEEHKEDIRQRNKQHREEHKEQKAESDREYRRTHSEHIKQYREEHKDGKNELNKQWREENREHHRELKKRWCKEHVKERAGYGKLWRKNNPDKRRLNDQNRSAKKRQLQATLTISQWKAAKEHFDNKCAYCGKDGPLHQDHFIALSRLGEYSFNNIIPACPYCNQSKNDHSFFDWYPKQTFYSKRREAKILKFLNYKDGVQQLSWT